MNKVYDSLGPVNCYKMKLQGPVHTVRQTFHEPDQTQFKLRPTQIVRATDLIKTLILIPAALSKRNAHFSQSACKMPYQYLCIRFST